MSTTNISLNQHPSGSAQSNNAVINNNWTILDAALGKIIGRGILANRPTATLPGSTYFVTDQPGILFYVWDGSEWNAEKGTSGFGTLANRPASAPTGYVYIPSDMPDVVLYVYDGSAWIEKSGGGGGGGGGGDNIGTGFNPYFDETSPNTNLDEVKAILSKFCNQVRYPTAGFFKTTQVGDDANGGSNGVLAYNGCIYYIKNTMDLYKVDPKSDTESLVVSGVFASGGAVTGGVAGDGKVVFHNGSVGLTLDPQDDSYTTQSASGFTVSNILGTASGGVIAYDFSGYMRTYDSDWTNPSSNIVPPSGMRVGGWCLLPDGKIMLAPRYFDEDNFYIYSPNAETFTEITGKDTNSNFHLNGVLTPEGKVVWLPEGTNRIHVYNLSDGTWEFSNTNLVQPITEGRAICTCLLPSGEVLIPNQADFRLFDPRTLDIITYNDFIGPPPGEMDNITWGMLPDGRLYGVGSLKTGANNQSNPLIFIDMGFAPIGKAIAHNRLLVGHN